MSASLSTPEPSLTCRHWLLNPTGCVAHRCRYSHALTGILSPPSSSFACYAFNNGGCPLSQDQCLFAHLLAGPGNQHLQIRHPDLKPSDAPIAEAVARAGFDCSNWPQLKDLIESIRSVTEPVSYPDRWTGPAAYQSNIYPDHWKADLMRERKGVNRAYQDGIQIPSVPAFVVSARQIIRNLNPVAPGHRPAGVPATGTNKVALGTRGSNKRPAELINLLSSSPKRAKTEAPELGDLIDLTQDDEPSTSSKIIPIHPLPPRPALTDITNLKTNDPPTSQKQRRRQKLNAQRAGPPQQKQKRSTTIHTESLSLLVQIASKLRSNLNDLVADRDTLRRQWDQDEMLQLQSVTDHLVELNGCFAATEKGIQAAVEVIEERLL